MKLNTVSAFFIAAAITASSHAFAADTAATQKEVSDLSAKVSDLENKVKRLEDISAYGFDLGFGVEDYRDAYLADASIGGDGIVRVTDKYNVQPSFWLQFSWLSDKKWFGLGEDKCTSSVCTGGVFTGVRLAGQNSGIMDAFSLGVVLASFKMGFGDTTQKSKISRFYIGLGPVVHRTRTFVNGISEGSPLPTGATEISYKKSYETSLMLMLGVRL